jgi:hypothetical protein
MDELLTKFTQEQLLSELEKGNYWYSDGGFYSGGKKLMNERPVSVENAVYFRFYS